MAQVFPQGHTKYTSHHHFIHLHPPVFQERRSWHRWFAPLGAPRRSGWRSTHISSYLSRPMCFVHQHPFWSLLIHCWSFQSLGQDSSTGAFHQACTKGSSFFLRHLHARRMNAYIHIWSLEDWWQWACKLYFHREIHTHWTELPGCRQCCELRISAGLIRFDDNWSTAALTGLCLPRGCQVGYLRWSVGYCSRPCGVKALHCFYKQRAK